MAGNQNGSIGARQGCIAVSGALLLCAMVHGSAQAQGNGKPCSDDGEQLARLHYDLAEKHKRLDQHEEAVRQYLQAYKHCPRPLLVFNAAQAYWQLDDIDRALKYYELYIEFEPTGVASDVARERFFESAVERERVGASEQAEMLYRKYLLLAPNGPQVAAARKRVETFETQRARAEGQTKPGPPPPSETEPPPPSETEPPPPSETEPESQEVESPISVSNDSPHRRAERRRVWYRLGFWSFLTVTAVSGGVYTIMASSVKGLKQDTFDAVERYQNRTGTQLNVDSACDDIRVVIAPSTSTDLSTIKETCARGRTNALRGNIAAIVFWAGLAATGYFTYTGYLRSGTPLGDERSSLITPLVTTDTVGASLNVRF